jgi:hypothetical protein
MDNLSFDGKPASKPVAAPAAPPAIAAVKP